ncbi:MAG: type II toxin-antitoxin system RelE/ParE family toxin [Acidaminococcaceae bacterium]|nr:type II toxin-antitoxin system RelE/ParE family toxin [Acidaminococcaceae bacterium]
MNWKKNMASDLQKYAVKVSPLVKKQLKEIYTYVSANLKSPLTAKHLNYDIRNKITSLQKLPNCGIQIQTEPWKSKGMRFVPVNNYDIYYVVKEATVYVFAVLYSRRIYLTGCH